jgi:cytochrome c556|tara:strand:- start:2317 stop:2769 length:453 start_codon:yes stop_codon:yes gene_type:complete
MKIIFYITFLIIAFSVSGHEVKIEYKTTEEIINARMKKMSLINNLSQKIYKELNLADFDLLKKNTLELKHAATHFKKLFPINSKGGRAKNLIWEKKILFDEYNDNFVSDIDFMLINIDVKDIISLKESFNDMSTNCSSCHKKFKNKKRLN